MEFPGGGVVVPCERLVRQRRGPEHKHEYLVDFADHGGFEALEGGAGVVGVGGRG